MYGHIFSLYKKALLALAVILLPVIITFSYGYYKNRELLKEHVLNGLTVLAEAYEGQVYQFIETSGGRAIGLSSDTFVLDALEAASRGTDVSGRLEDYLTNKISPLLDKRGDAIRVIDAKGKVLASTDGAYKDRDVSTEDFFVKGISGPAYVEDIGAQGEPRLMIAAPVTGRPGKTIGVVTVSMPLAELNGLFGGALHRKQGAPSLSMGGRKTMEVYLVDRHGGIVASSRPRAGGSPELRVNSVPVRACLDSMQETSGFYENYRGMSVAGSSMCIHSLSWTLLVEYEAAEALASLTVMRAQAIVTGFIVAGLITMLFFFFRTILRQIQKLSSAAGEIAGGNYDITIPVKTRDEIGLLAGTFNSMAADIKKHELDLEQSSKRLKDILDNSTAIVYMKNPEGRYTFVNRRFGAVFNVDPKTFTGKTDHDIFPAEMAETSRKNDHEVFEKKEPIEFEEEMLQDGAVHTYISMKFPLFDSSGAPYAVCGFSTDITERKKASEELKEIEERLNAAQKIARLGSWSWDIPENSLWWSDEIYDIFGLKPGQSEAAYEDFLSMVHPEDRELVKHAVYDALYNEKPYSIEHRILLRDGALRMVHEQADVTFDPAGRPLRMVGTVQDITERKKKDFELKKLSAAIEQSVNIIFITDINGVIEYVNPMFEQVTGFSKADALGQTPRILASGEVTNEDYGILWKTVLSGKTWRGVYKNRKKTGGHYWCNTIISPIKDERGVATHFLAVQEDITQMKASEERIKHLAQHDALTGLINRNRFMERLTEWIDRAGGRDVEGALLLIDIDEFKFINDTYGTGMGDDLLLRLSQSFNSTLEDMKKRFEGRDLWEPFISRLSGDEFAVFLPSFGEAAGLKAAEEFRVKAGGLKTEALPVSVTASIGIALYPRHGLNTRDLLTRADASLFRAKELGRNRCHLFRPEDKDLEKIHSRMSWKEKILKALKEDRFEPWFQPILSLADNRVHHFEALARLRDTDGSVLLPGAFIDIAERFGLIDPIDRVISHKTLQKQAEMAQKGKRLTFGMNLSGKDLGDDALLSFLKAEINETGADPGSLIFEITETAAIGDLERAIQFIRSLKSLGCHFSLDDFGVGFTSFNYLRAMNVDYIKIDGSFIRKLPESHNDQVFVKAMTEVARELGVQTIAEFVENEETFHLLKSLGVDYAQGYLIGKPALELVEEDAFLATHGTARRD